MQIALTEPQEAFVKQAVSEGRYTSEAEVVNLGLRMVEEHDRKLAHLQAMVGASLEDTREVSEEEMDDAIATRSKELLGLGIPL